MTTQSPATGIHGTKKFEKEEMKSGEKTSGNLRAGKKLTPSRRKEALLGRKL